MSPKTKVDVDRYAEDVFRKCLSDHDVSNIFILPLQEVFFNLTSLLQIYCEMIQ